MTINTNYKVAGASPNFAPVLSKEEEEQKKKTQDLLEEIQKLILAIENVESGPQPEAVVAPANSSSSGSVEDGMAAMAEILGLLQIEIAKANNVRSKYEADMGQAQIESMQKLYQDALDQIKKIQEAEDKENKISFWTKVASVALAVVVSAIAIGLGQVELLPLIWIMTGLQVSGAFDKAADLISEGLQKCGVSKEDADIIAKCIVIAAVILFTLAAAPEDAPEAAGEIADEAGSIGTEVAEDGIEGADGATSAAEDTQSTFSKVMQKVGDGLKKANQKANPFSKLSTSTNMAIANAAQVAASTNFIDSFIQAAHIKDDKTKEIIEETFDILMILLALLSSAGAAGNMGSAAEDTEEASNVVTKNIRNVVSKIKTLFQDNPMAMKYLDELRRLILLGEASMQVAQGGVMVGQGQAEEALGVDNALIGLAQALTDMINQGADALKENEKNAFKSFQQENQTMYHVADGYRGFSDVLLRA